MRPPSTCYRAEPTSTVSYILSSSTDEPLLTSITKDWTPLDVSNLCTTACVSSLSSWQSNVETVCDEETTYQAGAIVKARALPLSFTFNANLVCMQDSEDNWCFLESQAWDGSDYIRWDPTMCFPDDDDDSWVAPECADPGFNLDTITDDMAKMTNLYSEELFCSECFLKLYRQRLLNPWLPNSNFTDYLIEQFDTIQENCSTTLPYVTSAATLFVGVATPTAPTTTIATSSGASSVSGSASSTLPTATPTCLGQVVEPIAEWLICDDLSDTYNVSTGDARVYTGDHDCYFTEDVCLPPPCELDIVWDEPSWYVNAFLCPPTSLPVQTLGQVHGRRTPVT